MQNDGSQSWIVISRGGNKYVTELPEKLTHDEEVSSSAVKRVATKHQEQFTPSLSSYSTIVLPIDQEKWNDIVAVQYIDEESLNISKTMIRILTTSMVSSRR